MKDWLVTPLPIRDILAGWFALLLLAAAVAIGLLALDERKPAAVGPEVLPSTHWTLHSRAAIREIDEERETYRAAGPRGGDATPAAETTVMAE